MGNSEGGHTERVGARKVLKQDLDFVCYVNKTTPAPSLHADSDGHATGRADSQELYGQHDADRNTESGRRNDEF